MGKEESHTYFVFNGGLLVLVQVHLNQLRAVELDTDSLAHDFSGEDQILKNGIVHSGQSTGAWALLFQRVARLAGWLGQNFAFANDHNVLARELLLQLTDQNDLDLLEHLLLWNGHVDDDGLQTQYMTTNRLVQPSSSNNNKLTFLLPNSISRARVMCKSRR